MTELVQIDVLSSKKRIPGENEQIYAREESLRRGRWLCVFGSTMRRFATKLFKAEFLFWCFDAASRWFRFPPNKVDEKAV